MKTFKHIIKSLAIALAVVVGLIAVLIVIGLTMNTSSAPVEEPKPDNKIAAYVVSQQIVEQVLKSPSTAQYPTQPLGYVEDGNNTYTVRSTVDSQNGFGAMIRSEYITKFTFDGTKFSPIYVVIDGKLVAGTIE